MMRTNHGTPIPEAARTFHPCRCGSAFSVTGDECPDCAEAAPPTEIDHDEQRRFFRAQPPEAAPPRATTPEPMTDTDVAEYVAMERAGYLTLGSQELLREVLRLRSERCRACGATNADADEMVASDKRRRRSGSANRANGTPDVAASETAPAADRASIGGLRGLAKAYGKAAQTYGARPTGDSEGRLDDARVAFFRALAEGAREAERLRAALEFYALPLSHGYDGGAHARASLRATPPAEQTDARPSDVKDIWGAT